jgi:hypothetical protein
VQLLLAANTPITEDFKLQTKRRLAPYFRKKEGYKSATWNKQFEMPSIHDAARVGNEAEEICIQIVTLTEALPNSVVA